MNQPVIRVAFAEDHEIVRLGIPRLLNDFENIRVDILAENGKNLIEQIKHANDKPNICMLDIHMQPMDGFETAVALKQLWPDIKTMALTSHEHNYYIIRMFLCGALAYTTRNISPLQLKAALETLYEGNVYYNKWLTPQLCKDIRNKKIKLPVLTDKEIEVIRYSCSGQSYTSIAEKMNTSLKAVESYCDRLHKKLGFSNRAELVIFAIQYGIIPLDASPFSDRLFFSRFPSASPEVLHQLKKHPLRGICNPA